MGFFTRTAMDMLMKTTHPEINRRQCWNLHPHRKPCTECKDICPYGEQIFTRPNLVKDWDPCTECGLCVSACRSGCIIPSPEQVQRDTSAADTDNDTIWIGCEKSTRKNSMVRTCISALTWETLAYLALNKKIVLDLTPCGECENDLCAAQLRKELTRLVDFFGQPMFEARFTLAYEPDEALYHVKELSRREMFEQVSHGSKSGTKKLLQMLPGLHSEDDGGVDFRLLLHQRTKQLKASMETPLKYGYYLPNFTDKCFGCGKCEKACRAGALKLEDLPDGQTRIVITPWKCSECEVCVASCSNHGIDGMKLRQLTTLGPVSVHKCTKTLCKECGKPIAPGSVDGVCTVCRIKARTKKRQEEAAARAQKLREVRKILPGQRPQGGRPARRPDPHRGHPLEMRGVRHLRGVLLQPRHRRDEAPPADHAGPREHLQVHQDPLRRLRQAHCTGLRGWHLLGLPDQAPHQKAAGGGRRPRQGARGRAGGQARCRGSSQNRRGGVRQGSGSGAGR